jgi:hypothetical protein
MRTFLKLILATSLAAVFATTVAGVASGRVATPGETQQSVPSAPSDSAAFPGGGTVGALGVNYPKGTNVPAVGTPQSGPTEEVVVGDHAAPSSTGGGFDWGDAGIGLAIGVGAAGVIALFVVGIRKNTATPITV